MIKEKTISSEDALRRLKEGNGRFCARQPHYNPLSFAEQSRLVSGQTPFATIIGCADSRVPPELIFDQGFGDIFVIRVAGNIASQAVIGSVEFAVGVLKTPLVVVLGHSGCGAVRATLADIAQAGGDLPTHLASIVADIRPSLEPLVLDGALSLESEIVSQAVELNVQGSVAQLSEASELIAEVMAGSGVDVKGAIYDLASGEVRFDDVW